MPKRDDEPEVELIWVQAGPNARDRVALWDRDPQHPNGEVYVAGPQPGEEPIPVEVAKTTAVLAALRDKRLVEVRAPANAAALREQAERGTAPPLTEAPASSTAPAVATSGGAPTRSAPKTEPPKK